VNTINDLRGMLSEHAEITDTEAGARSASIAGRVRVGRRRRAAGVGVAAAVALVAATAVGLNLPSSSKHQIQPAGRLLGVSVPRTITANGYTYDYASAVTADPNGPSNSASVKVDATDGPVLVSWVTRGSNQEVVVKQPGGSFISNRPDFADHTVVYPGDEATRIRVSGHVPVALAIYHLGSAPPAGVSVDGITFRRDVPGRRLLSAGIAPEGANRVSFGFTVPRHPARIDLSRLCRATGTLGREKDAWLEVAINGRPNAGVGCSAQDSTFDPGSTWTMGPTRYAAGRHVTVSLRLLDRPKGHLLHDPHARIGMGAYVVTERDRSLGHGLSVPRTVEYDGHAWRLHTTRVGTASKGRPFTASVPASHERQLTYFTERGVSGGATATQMVDGHSDSDFVQSGIAEWGRWIEPGKDHTVGARVMGRHAARVAIGIYRMVD